MTRRRLLPTIPVKWLAALAVLAFVPATSVVAETGQAAENPNAPAIEGDLLDLSGDGGPIGFNQTDARAVVKGGKLEVTFEGGSKYPNIKFPVPEGGWNLSAFGGVEIEVTNPGPTRVKAFLRVDNPGGEEEEHWNTESMDVKPGETKTLKMRFGTNNGAPGFPLDPAWVSGIQLFLVRPKADITLVLSDLKAHGSPADREDKSSFTKPEDRDKPVTPPDWLGKRPPVEGDWILTLDENFDGEKLDDRLWNTRFVWDGPMPGQLQRYAPENVILGDGMAKFKVEKRSGHENNDPKLKTRDYTSGLITSFGKWTQLYGYFEARIKLPSARGLWPAFWMMPDRGADSGSSIWQRRSTKKGGMEIDIMEILSEWGPGRANAAAHWDEYGPDHKTWGTSRVYFGPTPDGWHTFGVLWEPGKLTWYTDGKKVVEWENERVGSVPAFLKLNVQMGGWATKDVDDAALPDLMKVDHVRAWQLKERMEDAGAESASENP